MIGIFDSGFGGLTVAKELFSALPEYDYIMLGDQARAPYGPRSKENIQNFSEAGIQFLHEKGAKIILIACNTASAAALAYLQEKYPKHHILGIIVPAAEAAVKKTRFGVIGVVGTSATINSKVYEQEIKKIEKEHYKPQEKKANKNITVKQKATPLLVPLIEENWQKKPETKMIMRKYVRELKHAHVDTFILGCTHYPILKKQFEKIMGKNCTVINSSKEQALSLKQYLKNHPDLDKQLSKSKKRTYYTTDCPEKYASFGSMFLGTKIHVEKITL